MKIKDFNTQVRIGSEVYIGDRRVTVEDIDRREHTAKIRHSGWVRCSEFELQPNGIADPILSEKRSYKNQYVVRGGHHARRRTAKVSLPPRGRHVSGAQ